MPRTLVRAIFIPANSAIFARRAILHHFRAQIAPNVEFALFCLYRNLFICYKNPKYTKMGKRIGGLRRKTRYKFKKERRRKGKISITRYFQTFKEGDRVNLIVEPAVQKGMYHPRFMGKSGSVISKRGRCYQVRINDMGKDKTVIVHPVHLKRA